MGALITSKIKNIEQLSIADIKKLTDRIFFNITFNKISSLDKMFLLANNHKSSSFTKNNYFRKYVSNRQIVKIKELITYFKIRGLQDLRLYKNFNIFKKFLKNKIHKTLLND